MKIVNVIGTRPQFIKAAVVTRALRRDPRFEEVTIDTGQHYDHELTELLRLDSGLQIGHSLGIHGANEPETLARMLDALTTSVEAVEPTVVVVYGDTNSTLAGALAAHALGLPLVHVEAGLRSGNTAMREERNRRVTDHLSDLLLCPTPTAAENLAREGIVAGVHLVGDVLLDAANLARERIRVQESTLFDELDVTAGAFSVATVHRAETTDAPAVLGAVLDYLRRGARETPVVFPVHPRTRKAIDDHGLATDGLRTCAPLGYLDMTRLVVGAQRVYTDSGGVQREAYFHGTPCVTLREETEWNETVSAGWNRLWTVPDYRPRGRLVNFGDGRAAEAILDVLAAALA